VWTVAETRETLEMQVEHLRDVHFLVVFFPHSTRKEDIPPLPGGFCAVMDERGMFYFNPYLISYAEVLRDSLSVLLGHIQTVEGAMINGVPIVVQAVKNGIVAQDSLVDSSNGDAVRMQEHVLRVRFPGCTIVHKLPEQVIWDRMKEMRDGS